MPAIDYKAIRQKLYDLISEDQDNAGLNVFNTAHNYENVLEPICNIEIKRRRQHSNQNIANGSKIRYKIECKITVIVGTLEKETCEDLMNSYIANIETILMNNRKLGGLVSTLELNGGDMATGYIEDNGYFVSGGEIDFTVDADITI